MESNTITPTSVSKEHNNFASVGSEKGRERLKIKPTRNCKLFFLKHHPIRIWLFITITHTVFILYALTLRKLILIGSVDLPKINWHIDQCFGNCPSVFSQNDKKGEIDISNIYWWGGFSKHLHNSLTIEGIYRPTVVAFKKGIFCYFHHELSD